MLAHVGIAVTVPVLAVLGAWGWWKWFTVFDSADGERYACAVTQGPLVPLSPDDIASDEGRRGAPRERTATDDASRP